VQELIEFLESAEPYTSYRYVLGLVLGGLTLYFVYTGYASIRNFQGLLRDLNRQVHEQRVFNDVRVMLEPGFDISTVPPLKAQPGRIIKLSVLSACLRLISFRTLRAVWLELIGVVVLGAATMVAYWYVFTLEV
jgi:hypothetical protein